MASLEKDAHFGDSLKERLREGSSNLDYIRLVVQQNKVGTLYFARYRKTPQQLVEDSVGFPLRADQMLSNGRLQFEIDMLSSQENIAISSRVIRHDTLRMHIPLMDFAIPNMESSVVQLITDQFAKYKIPELTGGGAIFKTDDSFHFIGGRLLGARKQIEFLGRCLLTSVIERRSENLTDYKKVVDERYVGHSLIRGYTHLRITANGYKDVPRLIKYLDE